MVMLSGWWLRVESIIRRLAQTIFIKLKKRSVMWRYRIIRIVMLARVNRMYVIICFIMIKYFTLR